MHTDTKYILALNRVEGIGPATIAKLMAVFFSAQQAWEATADDLRAARFPENICAHWQDRLTVDPDAELEKCRRSGIRLLTLADPEYPELLKQIHLPPRLLYVRGNLSTFSALALAIVGSRKCTSYGKQVTRELTREIVENGLAIVSGLALGIDAVAHAATLDCGGTAIAVLGSGVDRIYPRSNLALAKRIMEQGTLISEFPPGTEPKPIHFPIRNRIISGMALGTLVVEAGETSGSLITAQTALEQNREVFAIPGNITNKQSQGTNALIQRGAKLVSTAADIFDELNLQMTRQHVEARAALPADPAEAAIISLLEAEPLQVDEIVRRSGQTASQIIPLLTMMEIKGLIRNQGGGVYSTG